MANIELIGRITESGKLEIELPADLEPGHVRVIIEPIDIEPDQKWYWTPQWQAAEREADDDIGAGRTRDFETIDDLLGDLDNDDDE